MALKRVAQKQMGKFGSLTASGHSKKDKSIFGSDACSTVCNYKDSFDDITVGDNRAFDIFSEKGVQNIDKQIDIITGKDKEEKPSKKFEMNAKSFAVLKKELGIDNSQRVTLNS